MTTEREMLDYAAKATFDKFAQQMIESGWNSRTNSADCAAMCANMTIDTIWKETSVVCRTETRIIAEWFIDHNNNREAAWRYAATMVAAKIGGMK